MKLHDFSVTIPEGNETEDGYVHMTHGTHYTIALRNDAEDRCDAEVYIDGQQVGIWRVNARSSVRLERPVHDTGRFTFYKVGTSEAGKAGIRDKESTGVIRILFKPEAKLNGLAAPDPRGRAGGTGLSGKSDQRFTSVATLDYNSDRFVTINIRLVSQADEPRPLFSRSTPVPPRV